MHLTLGTKPFLDLRTQKVLSVSASVKCGKIREERAEQIDTIDAKTTRPYFLGPSYLGSIMYL